MTIYLDLVLIINYCYDFLLLMCVSIILKRNTKIRRLVLGSLLGCLSLIIFFFNNLNIVLVLWQLFFSILICIVAFGFKDTKYTFTNIGYLYMCSIILAGFFYYLKNQFQVNYLVLLIIAPFILAFYIYQNKKSKLKQKLFYAVKIIMKNDYEYNVTGYIDTGNKLKDPITNKRIIVIENDVINKRFIRSPILVPYHTVNYHGLLKCFSPKSIIVDNKEYKGFLLGIYEGKFHIDGAKCILHYSLMEDLNV